MKIDKPLSLVKEGGMKSEDRNAQHDLCLVHIDCVPPSVGKREDGEPVDMDDGLEINKVFRSPSFHGQYVYHFGYSVGRHIPNYATMLFVFELFITESYSPSMTLLNFDWKTRSAACCRALKS